MRPSPTYRRHSAIALVFAAWCAAYGLPAELARNLTAQTVGLPQLTSAHPAAKKVFLDRLTTKVRRSEKTRIAFFAPYLAPAAVVPAEPESSAPDPAHPTPRAGDPRSYCLFQRPPPVPFLA